MAVEAREEVDSCAAKLQAIERALEEHVDPVDVQDVSAILHDAVEEFRARSFVLFGALGESKRETERKEKRKKAKPASSALIGVVPLANPIDHTPLLPTSLYPKRKTTFRTPGSRRTRSRTELLRSGSGRSFG
uniref:Uncharacterized protein n=1 Tax=Lotharella oceanica TaxID=641309 RepID=A0A7S2TNV6_9EUKA